MEPVKFEEHIKKQLQKREIKPSAGSWGKLEARLEQKENPNRVQFWWIGVAAAIAGVFFFLGTLSNNPAEPTVVNRDSEDILPEPNDTLKPEMLIATERPKIEEVSAPPEKVRKRELAVTIQEEPRPKSILESEEPEAIPHSQTEKLVAVVKPTAAKVSDAEVEALLEAAMAELEENQPIYATRPVDAGDLLNEVEYELELNFRQKVFEVLKEGFSKAKTAVANRNN